MASWTKSKDLTSFDPRALAHYRAAFSDPLRIHATCEDYRAGRTTDLAHDEADRDRGNKISCPLLAIWGAAGIPSENTPLDIWREWATDVRGFPIDSGHFLCEENPQATGKALLDFFGTG
jgi:haloacetate dehalogenase